MARRLTPAIAAILTGSGIFAPLRWLRAKSVGSDTTQTSDSVVDEAGEASFPASDPPGWTLGEDHAQ